jgi:hypothetical protein
MATTQNQRQTKKATAAPEAFVPAQSGKEHRWLKKLVGEWTFEVEAPSKPGQSPERATGSERVRMLGDLWLLAEGQGQMPGGGDATTLLTLGYDPQKETFLGTWIGSMMTHLWVYERGELDAAEKVLTLHSEGPNMAGEGEGKLTRYRETIELQGDDRRVFSSHMRAEDGSWQQIMTATYRRRRGQAH